MGLGVVRPGCTAISLGTSDTVFDLMPIAAPDPGGAGHVFGAPTGDFMALICFRNGSLARERVRDRFGMDWNAFSAALRATPPGNGGALMLPWFEPEITPPVSRPGMQAAGLSDGDAAAPPAAWVRACVEGQVLAMRRHGAWAAPSVTRIHAAGGAARNPEVLQVISDVFGAPVHRVRVGNAACLGAALRAAHADRASDRGIDRWDDLVERFVDTDPPLHPDPGLGDVYRLAETRQAELESHALGGA